jgi:tetratricopeptide (TPR) repeat protein
MREELSAVLSNRSAANCEAEDFIGALVDAEQVIQLKRNWTKGHFRKAKALLGMKRYEEARDAVELGLAFEPTNGVGVLLGLWLWFGLGADLRRLQELVAFRDEIIEQIKMKVKS